MNLQQTRCAWAGEDPLMIDYHDQEWGVPVHDDQKLFEFLVLESAQAGLSWKTILHKREGYRRLFTNFDPRSVSTFTEHDILRLLQDSDIIRNRAKITAAINNAARFLAIQQEYGSFSKYMWRFVDDKPLDGQRITLTDIPAFTSTAEAFAKDLKRRGFKFLGPTVIYAHMQAVGMVNDHLTSCYRYAQIKNG